MRVFRQLVAKLIELPQLANSVSEDEMCEVVGGSVHSNDIE